MATSRITFSSRFAGPETLVVCVLIAGVPLVLVPAGTAPTATSITSGTVDPMWWPDTGSIEYPLPGPLSVNPVRAWLDPETVFEVYKRADVLKGDAKVEPMSVDLLDASGAATAVVCGPHARIAQLLASSITSASTSVPLASTTSVPSTGIAWIGREALTYTGVSGGSLTGCTRGAFGSRARAHTFDSTKPALVTFGGWPRHLYGRLASVWLCRLSGTDLVDPTMVFMGTIGPGVQRTPSGARWSLPIDHITEVLQRKIATRTVLLSGIAHQNTQDTPRSPLAAAGDLGHAHGSPDRDGWHANWTDFCEDWTVAANAVTAGTRASYTGGRISLRGFPLAAGNSYTITAAWNEPPRFDVRDDDGDGEVAWTSQSPAPDTCVFLDGYVPIPAPGDAAKIPGTLLFTHGGADARYTLRVEKTAYGDRPLTALVLASGDQGSVPYVRVTATINGGMPGSAFRNRATLINRRTAATLGVHAEGSVVEALQAAALALDELDGGLHEEAIDWAQIGRALLSVGLSAIPSLRAYNFADGDTLLDRLTHELRLRGMALCTRYGRLAAFRTSVFSATEETSATILEADILCDDGGVPIEPEVTIAEAPVATSIRFELPNGGAYQWVDGTGREEFGDGAEVSCKALQSVPVGTDLSGIAGAIQLVAQQVLGVLAEPYLTVRVTLGPPFLGLQEGDLVLFTHPRVPTLLGTLGVSEATCQVEEVRVQVMGGKGRVVAALRIQEPDLAGYAPEALVAAGGLSAASAVVTLDAASAFGASCFARAYGPDGEARTNITDGFTAGDLVRLSQLARVPTAADESFTVVSVNAGAGTITLDGNPSASMAAAAAGQYGVILRFAGWAAIDAASATVRDRQERYLYIADNADDLLGTADAPKRWAA